MWFAFLLITFVCAIAGLFGLIGHQPKLALLLLVAFPLGIPTGIHYYQEEQERDKIANVIVQDLSAQGYHIERWEVFVSLDQTSQRARVMDDDNCTYEVTITKQNGRYVVVQSQQAPPQWQVPRARCPRS